MERKALLLFFLILFGVGARVALVCAGGRSADGPLSGGSDAPAYILLGKAVAAGRGITYVGQPTALRAPLYPIVLGGLDVVFGSWALLVMRWLQLLAAVGMAWICAETATLLTNSGTKWMTFAISIAMPTLLFFTPQILTEAFTALLMALFIYFLVRSQMESRWAWLIGMSASAGLLMLVRFNTLYVLPILAMAAWMGAGAKMRVTRSLAAVALALALVSPWVIRNLKDFHGGIVYSSQIGTTALSGVLGPEGRTQSGEGAVWTRAGWWLTDIETDSPRRLKFASEVILNRRAQQEAIRAWKEVGWRAAIRLELEKIGYFWLGTDQIFSTSALPLARRAIRASGVVVYWMVLVLAVMGWLSVKGTTPRTALLLLLYCIAATALHLPFNMNTRYRVPLIDPLLCVLAGIEATVLLAKGAGNIPLRSVWKLLRRQQADGLMHQA